MIVALLCLIVLMLYLFRAYDRSARYTMRELEDRRASDGDKLQAIDAENGRLRATVERQAERIGELERELQVLRDAPGFVTALARLGRWSAAETACRIGLEMKQYRRANSGGLPGKLQGRFDQALAAWERYA